MRFLIKQLFLCFFVSGIFAQVQEEVNPPENIKTIIFRGPTEDQFPVIQLGESMTLEFDDLTARSRITTIKLFIAIMTGPHPNF